MKAMLFLAALMPLGVLAQPINIDNNPNQPGYVVPSQQRMLQTNQQRAAQGGNINPPQQVLPNNNGGMLRQTNP